MKCEPKPGQAMISLGSDQNFKTNDQQHTPQEHTPTTHQQQHTPNNTSPNNISTNNISPNNTPQQHTQKSTSPNLAAASDEKLCPLMFVTFDIVLLWVNMGSGETDPSVYLLT